jgi:hypothetical protein
MTPQETQAAFLEILKSLTRLAMAVSEQARELEAVKAPRLKAETVGNVVLLPGVSLPAARRAQRKLLHL